MPVACDSSSCGDYRSDQSAHTSFSAAGPQTRANAAASQSERPRPRRLQATESAAEVPHGGRWRAHPTHTPPRAAPRRAVHSWECAHFCTNAVEWQRHPCLHILKSYQIFTDGACGVHPRRHRGSGFDRQPYNTTAEQPAPGMPDRQKLFASGDS